MIDMSIDIPPIALRPTLVRPLNGESNVSSSRELRAQVLGLMLAAGESGLTVRELRDKTGQHHGQASSVLSKMHMAGQINRLAENRDKCGVYVLPVFVNGRETSSRGRRDPVHETLEAWLETDAAGWSKAGRDPRAFVVAMRAITGYGS